METISLESSSEEEDAYDTYFDSVAKLKALKEQSDLERVKPREEKNELCLIEESKAISKSAIERPITRGSVRTKASTANSRPRKQKQMTDTINNDSDLEIVSVEENPNSEKQRGDSPAPDTLKRAEQNSEPTQDDNYQRNIKIVWRSKAMHRFNICHNTNFRKVYDYFANLEGVSPEEILITWKDKSIRKNDTPASIGLSVIDILEGGIIEKAAGKSSSCKESEIDVNSCVIKVQTRNKTCITIVVDKDQNFTELFRKCSNELQLEESKIKLYFDGEAISITDTPESLEIDDEACFDLLLPL